MERSNVLYVEKACAYITRNGSELLTFEGPGHNGLQIPKGTVEPGELLPETAVEGAHHLVTDVWQRRLSPPKRYVRNFYHVPIHEPRDEWTHVVTGTGEEVGAEFSFSWVDLGTDERFALDLDDYVHALPGWRDPEPARVGVAAD